MQTLDLRKELKPFYNPSAKLPEIVNPPTMSFLMIDGVGDPNTSIAYQDAVGALYSMAYTLKFAFKKRDTDPIDYPVMALEGLWWAEDVTVPITELMAAKETWRWTMMIMQPPYVTPVLVAETALALAKKKELPALPLIRLERLDEGACAQIMHIGPYAEERPTVERLHEYIRANGYELHGTHHEIYLGDPRKAAPEKLKTILRQPITKTAS